MPVALQGRCQAPGKRRAESRQFRLAAQTWLAEQHGLLECLALGERPIDRVHDRAK